MALATMYYPWPCVRYIITIRAAVKAVQVDPELEYYRQTYHWWRRWAQVCGSVIALGLFVAVNVLLGMFGLIL